MSLSEKVGVTTILKACKNITKYYHIVLYNIYTIIHNAEQYQIKLTQIQLLEIQINKFLELTVSR